jgi:tripartite-type tricarboxylate transporter receptor subunit TctC
VADGAAQLHQQDSVDETDIGRRDCMNPMFRWMTMLSATALSVSVWAQASYPSAPISLVVPFAAGSGTDAVARIVVKKLGERLNQPVLVDNKAGANGQIAATFVAKAKPDGYTLLMTTNTSHSANPSLVKDLKYDPIKDFTPIARVGELPFALMVSAKDPAKSMGDWLAYARANPGKLSYATPNSTSLVSSETIKRIGKVDVLGVPYKSSPHGHDQGGQRARVGGDHQAAAVVVAGCATHRRVHPWF